MKTKRFRRLHDDDTTQGKKKAPFYWSRWDSNPRTIPHTCFLGDPKALPTELRLRHRFFQRTFLFNHSIDDTDDNKVDTIWLLGLQ